MIQKIIKVGNSYAVTIPKQTVNENSLEVGQEVEVSIKPLTTSLSPSGLTPEFLSWLEGFNARYKDALTELAKK